MKNRVRILIAVGLATYGAAAQAARFAGQPGTRSTRDGVYTDAQAARGAALYTQYCTKCHGADLDGVDQAPPLTGTDFDMDWIGLTLGDLFERARVSMPADNNKGTLTNAQHADLLAFLLSKDGFRSGAGELPGDTGALKHVEFVSAK